MGDYLSRAIVDCSGAPTAGTAFMGAHLLPMDHDRQDASTPATRCAAGIMPVAVSLSNAPPTATPSSVMFFTVARRSSQSHADAAGITAATSTACTCWSATPPPLPSTWLAGNSMPVIGASDSLVASSGRIGIPAALDSPVLAGCPLAGASRWRRPRLVRQGGIGQHTDRSRPTGHIRSGHRGRHRPRKDSWGAP